MTDARIAIATNNGDIGGGEVMLLQIAEALRQLGIDVLVLGPEEPSGLVTEAAARGHDTEVLPSHTRLEWMAALRRWRIRNPHLPLWCNGLVPSFATALLGPRLVHLHVIPTKRHWLLAGVARLGARRTIAISYFMASRLSGTPYVMPNWTGEIEFGCRDVPERGTVRIGFMGRLTRDKGVHVLAEAIRALDLGVGRSVRLVLAGENRFGDTKDDEVISRSLAPLGNNVDYLGWVSREDFFAAVDVAVFPSTWDEPFGLVAAEAMASGTPFVISDAGGLVEVAGPDHPWIARRSDINSLAQTLTELLRQPPETVREAVCASRERWEREYSPRAGLNRVADLLKTMERTGWQV